MYKSTNHTLSKRGYTTLLALLISIITFAQNVTVKGVVYDETNMPLIGATVQVKGGQAGAATDLDGNFTIKAAKNSVLTISYIGYLTQEVKLQGKTQISIKLVPDNKTLDEVVVVGYGSMKKGDLTGSVSSVAAKAIEGFKTGSVVETLGGQIAGVQITQSDGTPGSSFDIKIRGVGTVNGDSAPLFIVDGFEVANIDYLANSDIEKIDVLKDASAAAIYGARAANGVVLVTTKSGKEGKPVITYNGSASYRVIAKQLDLISPYEFVQLQVDKNKERYEKTYYQAGTDPATGEPYRYQTIEDYLTEPGIDWQDEAFKPTWSQDHSISIMGGTKESKYAASFSHYNENGIFSNSGFKKTTGKLRIDQTLTKAISFNATINYSNMVRDGIGTSGTSGSLNVLANLLRARPTGGNKYTNEQLLNSAFDPLEIELDPSSSQINPIKQSEAVTDHRLVELWGANAAINIKLTKDLVFKTSATYNTTNTRRDVFYGEDSSQAYRTGGVYGNTQMQKDLRWQSSNTLTYKKKINKIHALDVMLGHEFSYRSNEYLKGEARDFPVNLGNDNLGMGATPSIVTTYKEENKRLSFFARGQYNLNNRYLLTATIRADGSTVFSTNNKWGVFPAFSAAWRISEEKFMKNITPVSNLKLRLGWGTVGNDRIANYLSMDLYTMGKYGIGNKQTTVLYPKQLANKDLRWEGSTTTNLGIDLGLFNNRVSVTADFFIKNTKDLLLAQELAYVSGFGQQWKNVGKVQNKGIELSLNTTNIQTRDFNWQTDFNISFVRNKVKSLQEGASEILSATKFNSNFKGYDYVSYVGQSLGQMYGYVFDGVYQNSDFNQTPSGMVLKPGITDISNHAGEAVRPGMVKYKDIDGDGVITENDRTVIGNGQPKWYGGITNTFKYKGVDFSFLFQFSYGNDVYNATRMFSTQSQDERANQLKEVADRWTPTHASNRVPALDGYVKYELYSRFIEDGSFLRLKNITLGYTLPAKWTKKAYINRVRVYTTAQNLFCITKYTGYDPEVNMKNSPLMPGFDWGAYPKSKAFTFGVEVQF